MRDPGDLSLLRACNADRGLRGPSPKATSYEPSLNLGRADLVSRHLDEMISPVLTFALCNSGPAPIPVAPPRDWLDYVSAFSGVVGALLAGLAIAYAAWQSVQTKRDLTRERRIEFELGLLAEIRRQMSITQFQHLSGYVGALIPDSNDESDLPVLRAIVGTKSGPTGRQKRDQIRDSSRSRSADVQSEWLRAAAVEVDTAIDQRLSR